MRIVNADPQQVLSAVMRIPRPSKTAVAFTGLGLATLGYAVKSGTSHMRTPAQIQWFGQTQTPTFKKYVVDEVGDRSLAHPGHPVEDELPLSHAKSGSQRPHEARKLAIPNEDSH